MELLCWLVGLLMYTCTFCVLVKKGTLFSYTNIRTVMDVKRQMKVFVIHTNTARDPVVYGTCAGKYHPKLDFFQKLFYKESLRFCQFINIHNTDRQEMRHLIT